MASLTRARYWSLAVPIIPTAEFPCERRFPKSLLRPLTPSFTAWLKVLKQKEGIPVMEEMAEENEKEIAAIAEKANTTADVITEAMAEIWVKQGNKRKAIDIYSKLSFIFPEKSVYFASRIEQLKQKK